MGAIRNFFTGFGNTLGGAIAPDAYMAGVDEETRKKIQRGALSQLGLGLISQVGSSSPLGSRLGQAFGYAGHGANQAAQSAAQDARDNRREATQVSQFGQSLGVQQGGLELQKQALLQHGAEFKAQMEQTAAQAKELSAYHTQALEISRASGSSEDRYRAAEIKVKLDALSDKREAQAKYQAILDDGTPLDSTKIARLRAQSMKFQAPSLFDQLFGVNAPQPGATTPTPTPTPQGSMPGVQAALNVWDK